MNQIPAARRDVSAEGSTLYMAIELSLSKWVLSFSSGGSKERQVSVTGGELGHVLIAIAKSKERMGLSASCRVMSCYEAGRDGFWLHRWLESEGVKNVVLDPSSIEVPRRARRVKTDRVDARKLLDLLIRYDREGGGREIRAVRIPTVKQEDGRRLHRGIQRLQKERTGLRNRMRGLLFSLGIRVGARPDFEKVLSTAQQWDGTSIPPGMLKELQQANERLELVEKHLSESERERHQQVKTGTESATQKTRKLMRLKGIGPTGGWNLVAELFGWRNFSNRRQLGALAGLTGTPYDSGSSRREQGISKSGNAQIRSLMVELAWRWLKWQPRSKLSRWFMERFGSGGKRHRRVGIVALARKLLIALWRFVEHDEVPEGALVER